MSIYLIRHTKPANAEGICYGQSDLDVENTFLSEVSEIKKYLPELTEFKFVSSPLKRCRKLAEELASEKEITFANQLKELNFGNWENTPWDKIDREEIESWGNDFVKNTVPGGESYLKMYERVSVYFQKLDSEENIILVAHSGTIRCILAHLLEIPLHKSFDIKLGYGSVIKVSKRMYGHHEVDFLKTN